MLIKIRQFNLNSPLALSRLNKKTDGGDIWVNLNYVKFIKRLSDEDVERLNYSGWNVPSDILPLYEVSIKDERVQIYTNEDGFLNLTKGIK